MRKWTNLGAYTGTNVVYLEGFTKKQCSSRRFVVVAMKLLGEELLLVGRH